MILWIILALVFGMRQTNNGALVQSDAAEDTAVTVSFGDGGSQMADAAVDTVDVEPVETAVVVTARTVMFSTDVPTTNSSDTDEVPPEERGCSH